MYVISAGTKRVRRVYDRYTHPYTSYSECALITLEQVIVWIICPKKLIVILLIACARCRRVELRSLRLIVFVLPNATGCIDCGCRSGLEQRTLLLGNNFSLFIVKLKYISIYKSHRLCPTKYIYRRSSRQSAWVVARSRAAKEPPRLRAEGPSDVSGPRYNKLFNC